MKAMIALSRPNIAILLRTSVVAHATQESAERRRAQQPRDKKSEDCRGSSRPEARSC